MMKKYLAYLAASALCVLAAHPAWSMPITKQLVVNVIDICDNSGGNCAWTGPAGDKYFEAEADKIWAQAGIDIKFVTQANLWSSTLLNGQAGVGNFTASLGGPGTTMYLVNSLACSGCTLFGEAWLNAGGLVINMSAVQGYSPAGRLDTIAHELGHNLGLYTGPGNVDGHDNSNPNFLMASGSIRNIPGSLSDIAPDGLGYDLLSAGHIATARSSSLLIDFVPVPEPGSLALLILGFLSAALAGAPRRLRSAKGKAF